MEPLNHLPVDDDDNRAAPAAEYEPNQRVWVVHHDCRWPGVVLFASDFAATVRYRPGSDLTTAVDTVHVRDLAVRTVPDQYVDAHGFSYTERFLGGETRWLINAFALASPVPMPQ
jgi:hypothetical protein